MEFRNKQNLGRPRLNRRIRGQIRVDYFKPRGIPMVELETVVLSREELEALRLKNIAKLDQTECAERMHTSQSTFQRILSSAYEKASRALVEGRAIKIIKNKQNE